MLKFEVDLLGVLGVLGEVGAVTTGGVFKDVRLDALRDAEALLRSTEVLAVCRDWGRWKGLELVSDMVAVAEDADQARRLRVFLGDALLDVSSGMGSCVGVPV